MELKFFRRQLHVLCDKKIVKFYDNNVMRNENLFFRKIILKNKAFLMKNFINKDILLEKNKIQQFGRFYEILKDNISEKDEKTINIEYYQKINQFNVEENIEKEINQNKETKGILHLFHDFSKIENPKSEMKFFNIDYNINEIFYKLYNILHFQESINPKIILKSEKSDIIKEKFSEKTLFLELYKKNENLILKDQKNYASLEKFLINYFENLKKNNNFDFYFKPIKTYLENNLYKKTIPQKLLRKDFKINLSEIEKLKIITLIFQKYIFLYKDILITNKINTLYYEEEFSEVIDIIKKLSNLENSQNIIFKKLKCGKKIILKTSLKEILMNPEFYKKEKNFLQ